MPISLECELLQHARKPLKALPEATTQNAIFQTESERIAKDPRCVIITRLPARIALITKVTVSFTHLPCNNYTEFGNLWEVFRAWLRQIRQTMVFRGPGLRYRLLAIGTFSVCLYVVPRDAWNTAK